MFCPDCRAEYRTGFTQCSQCAVELVEELSPAATVEPAAVGKPIWRAVMRFLMHQFIATFAIAFTSPIALGFFAAFVSPFGWNFTQQAKSQLLSTPYFPVQIALALFAGWGLGRLFPRKGMYWVWVLPLAVLVLAFESYPAIQPFVLRRSVLSISSPISHYFGRGCDVRDWCFDQLNLTMPFYASSAYSIGSYYAQKVTLSSGSQDPVRVISPWRTFLVSSLVWLCVTLAYLSDSGIPGRLEGVPLSGEAGIVLVSTVLSAAATTLLTVIGAGLVGHFRRRSS
jgi:hypothetical protein